MTEIPDHALRRAVADLLKAGSTSQSAAIDYAPLVATVRERSVLQPIQVRETGTGDHVVTVGHRRHAASIDAALMSVPCALVKIGAPTVSCRGESSIPRDDAPASRRRRLSCELLR